MKRLEMQNTYFLAAFILFSNRDSICSEHIAVETVFMHCTQTGTDTIISTPKTIIPEQINASIMQQSVSESRQLRLDLCPNIRFLKISWMSRQTHERNTTLCYRLESTKDAVLIETVCFYLHVYQLNHSSAMNCWFPMRSIEKEPIITAWVHQSVATLPRIVSGILNTSALDPVNSCTDICEVVAMEIGSQIDCQDTASILHDTATVVRHLSFNAIDKLSCENDNIQISRQTDDRLEYHLNCRYRGLGYVKVLYQAKGKNCLKYQLVRVNCPNGNFTKRTLASEAFTIHSFGTFVIFGLVCTIVITAMFFSIIFVVQWFMYLRITYSKQHRSVAESCNASFFSVEESVLSQINKSNIIEGSQRDESLARQSLNLARKISRKRLSSSTLNKTPEKEIKLREYKKINIRKSVTVALLEETDPFYKKRILFLPIPFDIFTHEVTKILKTVFENEAGILSQCCYDRSVYKHYMTGDRTKWIEHVLGDHDKILIFLCFTSICTQRSEFMYDTMVEEILDHLVLSKVTLPRLCKVFFLYLTDNSVNVQKQHYGDVFHISTSESYRHFVCDVLNYSGRNRDAYPDLIYKMLNCEASNVFLRYIGIHERKALINESIHGSPQTLLE